MRDRVRWHGSHRCLRVAVQVVLISHCDVLHILQTIFGGVKPGSHRMLPLLQQVRQTKETRTETDGNHQACICPLSCPRLANEYHGIRVCKQYHACIGASHADEVSRSRQGEIRELKFQTMQSTGTYAIIFACRLP